MPLNCSFLDLIRVLKLSFGWRWPKDTWALGKRLPCFKPRNVCAVKPELLKSWSLEIDYSRAPCLGAHQKTRGLWERDCSVPKIQSYLSIMIARQSITWFTYILFNWSSEKSEVNLYRGPDFDILDFGRSFCLCITNADALQVAFTTLGVFAN